MAVKHEPKYVASFSALQSAYKGKGSLEYWCQGSIKRTFLYLEKAIKLYKWCLILMFKPQRRWGKYQKGKILPGLRPTVFLKSG